MPTKKPTKKTPRPAARKVKPQRVAKKASTKKPASKKAPARKPSKKAPAKKTLKKRLPRKPLEKSPVTELTKGKKPVTQHIAIVQAKKVDTRGRGWCLVLQPNKLFARYSDMVCALTHMNMNRAQALQACYRNGMAPEQADAEVERALKDPGQWKRVLAWVAVEKDKALARLGIRIRD